MKHLMKNMATVIDNNKIMLRRKWQQLFRINFSICAKGAQCYLGTKSALTFLGGADLIIQVGSDSILLCSVIYKFVTTSTFNCHHTIACIWNYIC